MSKNLPQTSSKMVAETIAALMQFKKQRPAANHLKITTRALRLRMKNYPEIREAIEEVTKEAKDTLMMATPQAAEVIVDALEDRKTKFEAAKEVLDRAGVGAKQSNQTNVQVNMPTFNVMSEEAKKQLEELYAGSDRKDD